MNRLKSLLIGGLLASVSIAALAQNANAIEVDFHHDHFNNNTVAFDKAQLIRERQFQEQRAHELRERQAREFRERQARELHARELRERQARFYH